MKRTNPWSAGALAILLVSSAGCYGPFLLTRKLHAWNGTLGDKWINEMGFLVMAWLPIYSIATLADAIVFNSMEFWTGRNPLTVNADRMTTKRIVRGDAEAILTHRRDAEGEQLLIEQYEHGRPAGTLSIAQAGGMTVASDAQGHVLFRAQTLPDAGVLITNADGTLVRSYTPGEAKQLAESVSQSR